MKVNKEGICLEMTKFFTQVAHMFRGQRGRQRCGNLLNVRRSSRSTFQKVSIPSIKYDG
jgi:hypothetical protein